MSEERKLRENGYLRLALMFGDNNASTFRKNLEKMITLVLYDNYDEPMNVVIVNGEKVGE